MRYNSFLYIFPEQCAKYLHDKFKMHSELTVRELMVILKRIGIKTIKIHNNGKIYNVFYKREIDGIQDFEFLNNLHEYRKLKQIRDEWSKEPLIDYTPELSNMQNASDELLRNDDIYYTNESKIIKLINMKKDNKKALYESIMTSVAKEVKKALNESTYKINGPWRGIYYINNFNNKDVARLEWIDKNTYELRFINNIPEYDEDDFYKVIKNWANKKRYIIKTQKSEWIKPTYKYEEKWVEPEYPGYEFGHYENVRREIPGHYESHLEDL